MPDPRFAKRAREWLLENVKQAPPATTRAWPMPDAEARLAALLEAVAAEQIERDALVAESVRLEPGDWTGDIMENAIQRIASAIRAGKP